MIIIPAVDIKNGRCVRLYQGRADLETIYGENPAEMALHWQKAGAHYLHVVDLDGAFTGTPQNLGSVKELLEKVAIPVEFGGGLREMGMVKQVFKMGVDRVILGTAAISDPEFTRSVVKEFGRQIFVGLDVRGGYLAVEGWTRGTAVRPADVLKELQGIGIGGVVCTDIATDGTLTGPNFGMLDEILAIAGIRVIASGGVRTVEHLRQLCALRNGKLHGVIIGKALYTGDLKLRDAMAAVSDCGDPKRKNKQC